MYIKVLKECGYEEAALGFSLSYNSTVSRAKELFPIYASKQGGENKFLESIFVWLQVDAPRFWWQQADTYRVGSSKQSESTMHTILRNMLSQENFEYAIDEKTLKRLNSLILEKDFDQIKNELPEGFLQKRVWVINYKTLQNMYNQRKNHKLSQWQMFFYVVLNNIEHPEFIVTK